MSTQFLDSSTMSDLAIVSSSSESAASETTEYSSDLSSEESDVSDVSKKSCTEISGVNWSLGYCDGCHCGGPLGTTCSYCSTSTTKFTYKAFLGICRRCLRVGHLTHECWRCSTALIVYEYEPYYPGPRGTAPAVLPPGPGWHVRDD
jgi:hypothetical protein